jgi:hypothetical protein
MDNCGARSVDGIGMREADGGPGARCVDGLNAGYVNGCIARDASLWRRKTVLRGYLLVQILNMCT